MMYRGCMGSFFFILIGSLSVVMGKAMGIFGLILPWALIGFAYLLVDTILVELMWWDRNRNN